jgi:hypothetical protein
MADRPNNSGGSQLLAQSGSYAGYSNGAWPLAVDDAFVLSKTGDEKYYSITTAGSAINTTSGSYLGATTCRLML